ncbi:MAG: hypothetical protein EBE86_021055 [Hormoscilla sp. GUM202]|nr:hypothetical protein [Hormoscilla sp. GM7CHS1pb]MBO1349705.1 hypothetical protein [Hormoscilla sp. GUM202]
MNNEPIAQQPVSDGMIVRLRSSGPKIKINLGVLDPNTKSGKAGEKRSSGTGTGDASKDRLS